MKNIVFMVAGAFLACMAPTARSQADQQVSAQTGSSIEKGRVIQFGDATPLTFEGKPIAKSKAAERFVVLQVVGDSAFVSIVDTAGREIAAKAPVGAASAAQLSGPELGQLIVSLAKAGQYAAVEALFTATRSPELDAADVRSAAAAIKAANDAYRGAEAKLPTAKLEAGRLRKAAAEAEAPSRLVPTLEEKLRGGTLRRDAFELEKRAAADVADAEKARKAAVAKLAAALKVDSAATGPLAKYLNDPPTDPGVWGFKAQDIPPSYEETIDFINEKLKPVRQRVWYGTNTKKMIFASGSNSVVVFDPAAANPTVKYATNEQRFFYWVRISASGGKSAFKQITSTKTQTREQEINAFELRCADSVDAQKLAKAVGHLIGMFGGKADPF